MLILTGAYLLASKFRRGERRLTWWTALLIGVAQAVAIIPGVSRSGATISTGLLLGLGFAEAAEYSFILSIPAIIGALGLELATETPEVDSFRAASIAFAVLLSFIAGLIALKFLLKILSKDSLHKFAWYLLPLGAIALFYFTRR